jgi:membrane fusion protein (multidrug efflux system)
MSNNLLARLSLIALALMLAACDKAPTAEEQTPLATVRIETIEAQPLTISSELSGRIAAPRMAEVRARVAGVVLQRTFREGSDVKQGDVLFRIDPAPFKADLDSAEAALRKAEANAFQARLQEQRYARLIDDKAISGQDYDNARANARQTAADVAGNKAAVERARLNLGYATVTAPISGRIGRALVTEGALVTSGQQNALATVQQLDPIYVDITQSSTELLRLQRQLATGELVATDKHEAEVGLTLEDGTQYAERGRLKVSEVSVDPSTGSVLLRAVFPNPKRELLPGMFVRAQLSRGTRSAALLVPQRGVSRNAKGEATVMVVDKEDKVAERVVTADRAINGEWLITDGLTAGERVVLDGLQKIKPGAPVKTVPAAEQLNAGAQAGVPPEVAQR